MTQPPAPFEVLVALRCTQWLDETTVQAEAACLDAAERARAARLHFAADRRDQLAGHALLRRTLSALVPREPADWVFGRDAQGKPCLAGGGPLAFNLSHTRGWVACAVARGGAVGVDVERVRADADLWAIARTYFLPAELRALQACDAAARAERFAELWTLKEACAKGRGTGIGEGLPAVSFHRTDAGAGLVVDGPAAAPGWQYALFGLPDARLAVAAHAPGGGTVHMVLQTEAAGVRSLGSTPGCAALVG